jgi:hypothetical protein
LYKATQQAQENAPNNTGAESNANSGNNVQDVEFEEVK